MDYSIDNIVSELKSYGSEKNREGMARFGINADKALGVSMPIIRAYAKKLPKDHQLAQALWETEIHELRIMATLVDKPAEVTEQQMEAWVKDFNSWDVCDQCCSNLFDKTPFAINKALEWCKREEEFVKRAGFTMMATFAVHNKKADNQVFIPFLEAIIEGADDNRNFVKKAVNWALRQIGKRNSILHSLAIQTADQLLQQNSKAARWIATDALRELENEKIINRINSKK